MPADDADQPALRDASRILERIAADEAEVRALRDRLDARRPNAPFEPIPDDALPPDGLTSGEHPLVARRRVVVSPGEGQRTSGVDEGRGIEILAGRLLLTTRRLIVASGWGERSYPLEDLVELSAVGERQLLVSLVDGSGLVLDVDRPRLLRAQIGAARTARRGTARPWLRPGARSGDGAVEPGGLRAVPNVQLPKDASDVRLHGSDGQGERLGDLAIRQPVGEEAEDLELPRAERGEDG